MEVSRNKLIGIKDVDYMILNKLSNSDLAAVCQANTKIRKLCNDDRYWFNRLQYIFNINPQDAVTIKNFFDFTWKEMYMWLSQAYLLNDYDDLEWVRTVSADELKDAFGDVIQISNEYVLIGKLQKFIKYILAKIYKVNSIDFPSWINKNEFAKLYKNVYRLPRKNHLPENFFKIDFLQFLSQLNIDD
jgi:hypothetical protein